LLLAVVFFSLVLFYIRASGNLEYLSFGIDGLAAFLESFPYLLVISLTVFILIVGYLIKKNNLVYKLPFKYTALLLLITVFFVGSVLAYTDITNKLEQQVYQSEERMPFLKSFFNCGHHSNNRGVVGIIQEINIDELLVKTPRGLLTIDLPNNNLEYDFKVGQLIMAIGKRNENSFMTQRIRIVSQDNLPIINRNIHHRFRDSNLNATTTLRQLNSTNCGFRQFQHKNCN